MRSAIVLRSRQSTMAATDFEAVEGDPEVMASAITLSEGTISILVLLIFDDLGLPGVTEIFREWELRELDWDLDLWSELPRSFPASASDPPCGCLGRASVVG
jgi:hypothetical protein